jgi:CRP-like cAMP-binding protein
VELRDEFLLMRQKHLYNSIPFFNKIAYLQDVYTEVLHYLAQMTKEIRYGPGEIICQPGSTTLNLCSVVLGSVELRYENSNFAKTLAVGSFFGTADFLCKNATSCEARALKFSRISLLSS